MKLIDISTPKFPNTFTMVDDDDFERLNKRRWWLKGDARLDVIGWAGRVNGVCKHIPMHREIMNPPRGLFVDHIDGNILNNQKANLRVCTGGENSRNRRKNSGEWASKYKGVTLHKKTGKFQAQIGFEGKSIYLGLFFSEESAAIAYNKKAAELFGEFANLNKVTL